MKINISKLLPNPFQERKTFKEETIQELANSITQHGFFGSLLVRQVGDKYEIAFGERRLRACKIAGVKEIECEIKKLSDLEMMKLSVAENSNREDIDPFERAEQIELIQNETGLNQKETAKILGLSEGNVSKLKTLNNFAGNTKKLVKSGNIEWTTAVEAERKGGEIFVNYAARERLTRDEVRKMPQGEINAIVALNGKPEKKPEKTMQDIENEKTESIIKTLDMATVIIESMYGDILNMKNHNKIKVTKSMSSLFEICDKFIKEHTVKKLKI